MATALYRRYRPEGFSEMIGQAHVTEPLMTALRTGRIGHAYLFSGPRGCGKTTSARILARCLNCAEGPTDTPCGTCPSCVELSRAGGGSLDVVEIDAASHGGVDDARELRERAVFAPARDRYKIFIIDEAHMVTSGGFNALLKIVEEPPPHVKFIFATTEPDKVIGTIRSRTHHYPFRLIAPGTLIDYVQKLCDSEGVEIEPGVLPLVVRSGGGSVRDTLSILDQLIAGSDSARVTLERASGLLGFTSAELIDGVVLALAQVDAAAAFDAVDRVVQTGQDPRRFVEDLLERLRDLIVVAATTVQGASAVFRGVPEDQLQRMFEQAQLFGADRLSGVADTVSDALDRMTGATAPRLHLELMVARALVAQAAGAAQPAVRSAAQPEPQSAAPPARQPVAQPATQSAAPPSAPPAERPTASAPVPPVPGPRPDAAAERQPQPSSAPTSEPAPASDAPDSETDEAIDVIAAMKSAREFLNGGGAKAPMVPLGGHAPAATEHRPSGAGAASTPPAGDPSAEGAAGDSAGPVSDAALEFDELRELWPELLDELLESDREAWNAVKSVQPLAFDGQVLTVGLVSRSDLEVFKSSGAGPLREAIVAATGVSVKYRPQEVSAVAQSNASREAAGAAPEPAPEAAAETAAESGDGEPSPAADPASSAGGVVERQGLPGTAGPGSAAASDALPEPGPAQRAEPDPEPGPEPESAADPGLESGPVLEPEPDPEPASVAEPEPEPRLEPAAGPRPEPEPEPEPEPRSSRYGESVVRELLGARFIEMRPLPRSEE